MNSDPELGITRVMAANMVLSLVSSPGATFSRVLSIIEKWKTESAGPSQASFGAVLLEIEAIAQKSNSLGDLKDRLDRF